MSNGQITKPFSINIGKGMTLLAKSISLGKSTALT